MRLRDKLVLMYAVPNYNSDNRGKKEKEMKLRMLKASNSQQRNRKTEESSNGLEGTSTNQDEKQ